MMVNHIAGSRVLKNGTEQIVGKAKTGNMFGEIGVLCYRPQLFTVRTKQLSQLLRMNRTAFLNIIQANVGNGTIIMNNLLQHLHETKDQMMEGVWLETENMLAHGRSDLPLSLCFATLREDDSLLNQLLKRGLDPNELDNNGRITLLIAESKVSVNCVLLLLDYGAHPNSRDSEDSVPLWEAIVNGHEEVVKLLQGNGVTIYSGDVAQFSCFAAEKNNLDLLKAIVRQGGNITLPRSDGSTAFHLAVCEGNVEIVKFLIQHGADIDRPDDHGWTPRNLAEQQGHEEIIVTFQFMENENHQTVTPVLKNRKETRFLGRFSSEPAICPMNNDLSSPKKARLRRRASNYHNSLFGILSATNDGNNNDLASSISSNFKNGNTDIDYHPRVIISYPDRDTNKKLVFLPKSFEELLEIGAKKYGFLSAKVVTKDGRNQ